MAKKKIHYAWLILLGVILVRGFAGGGLNTTSALFLSPVSEELQVGIGNLSIYFSITSIVMVLWLPFAGKLINRYDIRSMAILGAALQALSFAAFGFLQNVYGWYLLAIPYAMGATLLINLLGPILINRWFAKNTGLMLGIQMAFVGLFGAVFQPLTSNLIAQNGWRFGYFILGGITFLAVFLTALFLLRNKPGEKGLKPYGLESQKLGSPSTSSKEEAAFSIPEKTAVRSASFFMLLLFMIAITGVGVFAQHIPTYGGLLGFSIQHTGAALAFASVGTAIGSIAIGIISDKIGALKTCYGILLIGILSVVGFFFSHNGFYLFALSTFLHGLTSAGIMVLSPILTVKFYGQADFEKIYAKVAMGAPLASILLIPTYGFIYDTMESYTAVLLTMLFLLILAALCITAGWKKRCTIKGCARWGR